MLELEVVPANSPDSSLEPREMCSFFFFFLSHPRYSDTGEVRLAIFSSMHHPRE